MQMRMIVNTAKYLFLIGCGGLGVGLAAWAVEWVDRAGGSRGWRGRKNTAPDSILEAGAATRGGTRIWGTFGVSLRTT
jgi:hypothetical protein